MSRETEAEKQERREREREAAAEFNRVLRESLAAGSPTLEDLTGREGGGDAR